MIISFNPAIFQTQDSDMQSILADILIELFKDNHFIDLFKKRSVLNAIVEKYLFI